MLAAQKPGSNTPSTFARACTIESANVRFGWKADVPEHPKVVPYVWDRLRRLIPAPTTRKNAKMVKPITRRTANFVQSPASAGRTDPGKYVPIRIPKKYPRALNNPTEREVPELHRATILSVGSKIVHEAQGNSIGNVCNASKAAASAGLIVAICAVATGRRT
jgi:hypothetical protein